MAYPEEKQAIKKGGGFWRVFLREWRRIGESPFYLIFIFIFPIAACAVFSGAFTSPVPRRLPVAVHDADQSALSRQLIRMADASPTLDIVEEVDSMTHGAEVVRQGKAYAIMYIPADFEKDVKRIDAPAIAIYCNTQWLLTSGLVSRALREVIGTMSAGVELRSRMMRGEDPAKAWECFEPIKVEQHPLYNPYLNYRDFLLPPLFIAVLNIFITLVTVHAAGVELKEGTAGAWLEAAGGRIVYAFFGKMFPYTLLFNLLILFCLTWLYRYQQVPFQGNVHIVVLATVLFVLSCQAMGFSFVALTSNQRLAGSLAGFYTGPAFAFAGFTFPVAGMPFVAKAWGACLSITWYGRLLLAQASRGASPLSVRMDLVILAGFALVPLLLLLPRLRRLLANPEYWGRD